MKRKAAEAGGEPLASPVSADCLSAGLTPSVCAFLIEANLSATKEGKGEEANWK